MRISSVLRGRSSIPDPPGYDQSLAATETELPVKYGGTTYRCRAVTSSDGSRRVAYGRNEADHDSRMFVFSGEELLYAARCNRPIDAGVANDGTAVLLDGGAFDELDGRVTVFDASGTELFTHGFSVNLRNCAISADGRLAAVATRPPETGVHLIDVQQTTLRASLDIDGDPIRLLGFTTDRAEQLLYVAQPPRDDPYFALSADGSVGWRSERFRDLQPLSERIRTWLGSLERPGS